MLKKIMFSAGDEAGRNIAGILSRDFLLSVYEFCGEIIYLDYVPDFLRDVGLCIVASRHKSMSGIPTLTVHSPGNFGVAEAGGVDRMLGVAPALYLRSALKELKAANVSGFEVCFEVTHHGPTVLSCPVVFVEVGSCERDWSNVEACRAAAEAIKKIYESEPEDVPSAVGFGGGHYARKFSLVDDYALGHICPKYALKCLDLELVKQMVEKTFPRPSTALVEKKGLGGEKSRVAGLLSEAGLEVVYV